MKKEKKLIISLYAIISLLLTNNIFCYLRYDLYKAGVQNITKIIYDLFLFLKSIFLQINNWINQQEYDFSLNNREKAFIILFFAFFIYCMKNKGIRDSLITLLKILIGKVFRRVYFQILIYTFGIIFILYKIGFWNTLLLKDTIIWFSLSSFFLAYRAVDNNDKKDIYKKILKDSLTLTVFIQFLLNIYTFNIILEIVIISLIILISLMIAVIELDKSSNPDYELTGKILEWINIITGLSIILFLFIKLVSKPQDLLTFDKLVGFTYPIILTLLFIPYLAFLITWSIYDDYYWKLKSNKGLSVKMKIYFHYKLIHYSKFDRFKLLELMEQKRWDIVRMKSYDEVQQIFA